MNMPFDLEFLELVRNLQWLLEKKHTLTRIETTLIHHHAYH